MKTVILFLLALSFILPVLAQQPQLIQERQYLIKAFYSDILASTQDQQGNVYYSGTSWTGISKYDNYFLKVKPNTDTLWTRKNPIKLDYQSLAIVALSNNEVITGGNYYYANQQIGMTLRQINGAGSPVLTKNFASPSRVNSILPMPGKELLLGGWYGTKNFGFTRTDSLGNVKWTKAYQWAMSNDGIVDMKVTKSGQIIAAGASSKPVGPIHLKLMLLNQNGDSLLGRQLILTDSASKESMFYNYSSVLPISNGGFLITAAVDTVMSTPGVFYRGMVVKVDANLNYQWKYIHRTPTVETYEFTKAKELADGSLIVLGHKSRPLTTGGINGFQIYRFSPYGQLLNVFPFTSAICTQVLGITLDALPDSTFMIGGRCGNFNPDSYGFYVAKVKIPGLPLPLPPVTISGTNEDILAGIGLGQSYPNPTAAEAIIPYSLPKSYRKASIIIREIATGREIRKYELKRNESSLKVDVSNLSNGLYLYSLIVDEKPVATKKLAVMK